MGRKVLALVEALPKDALLVAICGNNRTLERNLRALIHTPRLQVLGFTDRMSDYMDAADLFITKPGGLSTTEAATKGVPLVLFNAVPGCETRNLEFLLSIGCAVAESGTHDELIRKDGLYAELYNAQRGKLDERQDNKKTDIRSAFRRIDLRFHHGHQNTHPLGRLHSRR